MPSEEIAFTARQKINSHSQIFRYGQSTFCLPHRPKFSDFFDLCLHWLSVVRGTTNRNHESCEFFSTFFFSLCTFVQGKSFQLRSKNANKTVYIEMQLQDLKLVVLKFVFLQICCMHELNEIQKLISAIHTPL